MPTDLPYDAITVSPITHREGIGGWTWTVTVAEYAPDSPRRVPVSTTYRTDSNGRGLWVVGYPLDRQILGHAQFDLNCRSLRRNLVLAKALVRRHDDEHDMTWRQVYANRPRIS